MVLEVAVLRSAPGIIPSRRNPKEVKYGPQPQGASGALHRSQEPSFLRAIGNAKVGEREACHFQRDNKNSKNRTKDLVPPAKSQDLALQFLFPGVEDIERNDGGSW